MHNYKCMTVFAKNAAIYRKSKEGTPFEAVDQSTGSQKAARLRYLAFRDIKCVARLLLPVANQPNFGR